jgi:hypothetical protein
VDADIEISGKSGDQTIGWATLNVPSPFQAIEQAIGEILGSPTPAPEAAAPRPEVQLEAGS